MANAFTWNIYQFGERTLEIPEKLNRMRSFFNK